MKTERQEPKAKTPECGPQNLPMYWCGGVAYIYCIKNHGHEGDHQP